MEMAYSEDLRERVIAYVQEGHTQKSACKVFKVGRTALKRWTKRYSETGNLADKKPQRSYKKIDPEKLSAYMKEHPDAYLREIAEVFGFTGEAVRQALVKLSITRKKKLKYSENAMKMHDGNSFSKSVKSPQKG